jgi:hypothetical protein
MLRCVSWTWPRAACAIASRCPPPPAQLSHVHGCQDRCVVTAPGFLCARAQRGLCNTDS